MAIYNHFECTKHVLVWINVLENRLITISQRSDFISTKLKFAGLLCELERRGSKWAVSFVAYGYSEVKNWKIAETANL